MFPKSSPEDTFFKLIFIFYFEREGKDRGNSLNVREHRSAGIKPPTFWRTDSLQPPSRWPAQGWALTCAERAGAGRASPERPPLAPGEQGLHSRLHIRFLRQRPGPAVHGGAGISQRRPPPSGKQPQLINVRSSSCEQRLSPSGCVPALGWGQGPQNRRSFSRKPSVRYLESSSWALSKVTPSLWPYIPAAPCPGQLVCTQS